MEKTKGGVKWHARAWECPNCERWIKPRGGREGISKCSRCGYSVYVKTEYQTCTYQVMKLLNVKQTEINSEK